LNQAALLVLGFARLASADPFTPGNIVVGTDSYLFEYTLDGQRVQAIPIGRPPEGSDPEGRGVAFDQDGNVYIYNGTFHPYLSTYDPVAQTWDQHTLDGWSTVNNITFGGVATYQNFVYASDCFTYSGGEPSGIVRFDRDNDYAAERFEDGNDYIMLSMGLDGLLYGLIGSGSPAGHTTVILDPLSMERVATVANPVELRGIAANEDGVLFGITLGGTMIAFGDDGTVYSQMDTHIGGADIHVTPDGLVVACSCWSNVIISDEWFSGVSSFSVGNVITTFVAVVPDF
jgi:hypothetical protein